MIRQHWFRYLAKPMLNQIYVPVMPQGQKELSRCGLVMSDDLLNLIIIGPGDGFPHVLCQAITWSIIWQIIPECFSENWINFLLENLFKSVICAKCQAFCSHFVQASISSTCSSRKVNVKKLCCFFKARIYEKKYLCFFKTIQHM